MVSPRLEFALERLDASDWRLFERFASEFLAVEFPSLRTTASASGDGGRDAELIRLEAVPRTGFQYSVTADWATKISATVTRVKGRFPGIHRIVYCTNQQIGAQFDIQREKIWNEDQIQVDLRDRSWFVEREADGAVRATASAELVASVVDPLLQPRTIVTSVATPLTREQGRIALLQLALNARDSETDRSLTKICFDSLVRAALVGTSAEAPLTVEGVKEAVRGFLPHGSDVQINALTESALVRLTRKSGPVKFIRATGAYHLSFQESQRWQDGAAEYLLDQDEVERDLSAAAFLAAESLADDVEGLAEEGARLRVVLEALLMKRGEAFVHALESGPVESSLAADVSDEIAALEIDTRLRSDQAAEAIFAVLAAPSDRTRNHLSRVLDAYTLFAFLQQTPDVQKSLSTLFSGGQIWLDTSAVLPLLAEQLLDESAHKPYSTLFQAARDSGIELYVTGGVVEEINHHLDNCVRYIRKGSAWRGRTPYIVGAYVLSGRSPNQIGDWIADIKGSAQPETDIADYLAYNFKINQRSLLEEADAADSVLRGAIQSLWLQSHEKRRQEQSLAIGSLERLIANDVESAVGVIQLRRSTPPSALGYQAWWLTLDKTALGLRGWLRDQIGASAPESPALSPDFLAQMLRLGPLRREAGAQAVSTLPISISARRFENIPAELIAVANATREKYQEYGELRIRREVRDAVNSTRASMRGASPESMSFIDELIEGDASADA